MKTILYALCVLAVLCTGCKKEGVTLNQDSSLLSFSFTSAANPELIASDVECEINNGEIIGAQGTTNDKSALVATFTSDGAVVLVNGTPQVSGESVNDFSKPVTYTVMAEDGSSQDYVVKLKAFTGIPILYITSESSITSKEIYVNGTMKVDGNMEFADGLYDGVIQIRGRGNSTWFQDKKPYKIKLPSKSKILACRLIKSGRCWPIILISRFCVTG